MESAAIAAKTWYSYGNMGVYRRACAQNPCIRGFTSARVYDSYDEDLLAALKGIQQTAAANPISVDVPLLFCHKTCSAFITESSEPAQPTIVECSQTSRPLQCLFSSPALRSRMIDAYLHLASHPAVPKREFRHWKRPTYLHKQLRQLQIKTNHKFLSL